MTGALSLSILAKTPIAAAAAIVVSLASTAYARDPLKLPDTRYEPIKWSMVDGWADDDHDAGFRSFLQSCKAILSGGPTRVGKPMFGALFKVCGRATELGPLKPGTAREFFESNFRPVRISPLGTQEGFVTGYYEPIVDGSLEKGDGFEHPLYRKPSSLLPGGRMAVAGAAPEGKKKKGRKRKLVAFYDRAAIDDGALNGRDLEICYLKNPVESFFAEIQGSLRVRLSSGTLMRLNYSAANGHPYYPVGRWLIERGIVSKEEMSMDRIREWMERNPEAGRELRRRNRSYVFFRETNLTNDQEPIGAQGVSLTPGRSIAVDRKLHTYGTPFFISGYLPLESLQADTWFKRLMIAQDTGGAILGPARADLYFGAGEEAASVAGRIKNDARFVMLVPNELLKTGDDDIPLPRARPEGLASLSTESEPAKPAPAISKPAPAVEPAKPPIKPADKPAAATVAKPAATAAVDAKPEPAKSGAKSDLMKDEAAKPKSAARKLGSKSKGEDKKDGKPTGIQPARSRHDPST